MSGGRQLLDSGQVEERLAPLLRAGAEVPLVVTGSSMVPFLRDRRDTVYLKSPEYAPIRTGDILFFRRESGQWILHRLHHRTAEGLLVINGDGQTWFETIRPGQVLGVAVKISRDGGAPFPARRWDWALLSRVYNGAAGDLIAAFLKESHISRDEAERLRKLLDEMEV